MTASLDNQAVIQRIVDVLKFDTTNIYGDKLIRNIVYGVPMKGKYPPPYCYVAFAGKSAAPVGPSTDNAMNDVAHVVKYIIVVVDAKKSGEEVEKSVLNYMLAIENRLFGNISLTDPDPASANYGLDAQVSALIKIDTDALAPLETRGQAIGGFKMTLTYEAFTA